MKDQNLTTNNQSGGQIKGRRTAGFQLLPVKLAWFDAWKLSSFRWKFWTSLIVFGSILASLPFFFRAIEARNGFVFSDILLRQIPPHNVSIAVFFLIWSSCILVVYRLLQDPLIMLEIFWTYNGVTLLRMACISLISLNPPEGLIPLADPITNQFYGEHYITHDLFFSGHTATVFLVFLCLKQKNDRIYTLCATILLGILLLVQHVHYTIDILAAPVFTYAVYRIVLAFTKKESIWLKSVDPSD